MHTEFEQSGVQPRRTVDEELGVLDIVFLLQLPKKELRRYGRSRGIDPDMEDYVRFRIDGRKEPVLLAIDLDDRLIEGDLLGLAALTRFEVGFLDPIMDR
jgi:hypothetical protein